MQESSGTVESAPGHREQENKGVMEQREVETGGTKICSDDPQTAAGTTTEV